mmetsp:Transcript_43098/g.113212  ORF Transcript_43098/g.113212 Transcript_43098/m.113212 type:complete len:234 (+) Transcript_43098:635-1336(+)
MRFGKLTTLIDAHHGATLVFGGHDHLGDILGILFHLAEPLGKIIEARTRIAVVADHDAACLAVVRCCQRVELLLPGGIPDLHCEPLYGRSGIRLEHVHSKLASAKVHADRRARARHKLILCEAKHQARLAGAAVANDDELDDVQRVIGGHAAAAAAGHGRTRIASCGILLHHSQCRGCDNSIHHLVFLMARGQVNLHHLCKCLDGLVTMRLSLWKERDDCLLDVNGIFEVLPL